MEGGVIIIKKEEGYNVGFIHVADIHLLSSVPPFSEFANKAMRRGNLRSSGGKGGVILLPA